MKVFTGLAERRVDFLVVEDVCDVDDYDMEGDDWTRGLLLFGVVFFLFRLGFPEQHGFCYHTPPTCHPIPLNRD